MNIFHFEWPQHVDSGIDLVGFATLAREKEDDRGAATAFVAGFQAKGTDEYFTENQGRSVQIGQHEDYWKSATLPVFVARISNDGNALLIEDALSSLHGISLIPTYAGRLKSIPTKVTIQSAATDIRLRMFAHALAPWVSQRLRSRTLAHEDESWGLNAQSAWSLLDYVAGRYSAFPIPGSWTDVTQYFRLVSFLFDDFNFRNQLLDDLKVRRLEAVDDEAYGWDEEFVSEKARSYGKSIQGGAYRLLGGMVELIHRFESVHASLTAVPRPNEHTLKAFRTKLAEYRKNETRENAHAYKQADEAHSRPREAAARHDVEYAIAVTKEVWNGAAAALDCTHQQFADEVLRFAGSLRSPAGNAIGEVAEGRLDLESALYEALRPWAATAFYVRHWT